MKTASSSFARTAILSVAMLLPAAASSSAEEFANTGASPPSRYEIAPDRPVVARSYGYVDRRANRYANPYDAHAEYGFMRFEYPCQLSPASLESSACYNH